MPAKVRIGLSFAQVKISMTSNDSALPKASGAPNAQDVVFLIFMVFVVIAVIWLGRFNFKEGLQLEDTKRNGEAWVAWLTETGTKRMEAGYEPSACAGGVKPEKQAEGAQAESKAAGTWGACLAHIQSASELKGLINPILDKPLHVVEKCDKSDLSTRGAISLSNMVSTPLGSAVPMVLSPLKEGDAIDGKLQIRVTVCDKGGYPIKIGELEF
jgi:hypothetical protein